MMSYLEAARRERASAGRAKRTIPIVAPLNGIQARDDDARLGAQFGRKLTNLESNGAVLKIRPGYATASGFPSSNYQAWSYEFGGSRHAVFRTATGLASDNGGTTETVSYNGDIMADEISNNLAFVGGGASPRLWNGTAFSTPTWSLPGGAVDALTDMTGIVTHHDRIFLWNENSSELGFYYAVQVAGLTPVTFVNFPLYALGNIKGRVKAMISLSIDAGHGANDVLAIITTTGQIIVYEGLDPGDETDWRIWGRIPGTSEAVAPNAVVQVGSDALVLTQAGVMSVRALLSQGTEALISPPSEQIEGDLRDDITAGASFRGWQMFHDPKGRYAILNYPTASDSYAQWVFCYDARGWFEWSVPARWWFDRAGELYFIHTDGSVRLFGAAGDDGAAITATIWTPWLVLAPTSVPIKTVALDLLTKSAQSITFTCLTDHRQTSAAITESTQTISLPVQDTAGSDFQMLDERFFVNEAGRIAQFRITLSATEAKWHGMTLNP